MLRRLVLPLAVILCAQTAHAMDPIPGEQRFESMLPPQNNASAGLGLTKIDGMYYLQLMLATEFNLGPVGIGLQVPLNVQLYPRDGASNNYFYGLLRRQDWDQTSDWVRFIRYVRLGNKRDTLFLRVGMMSADIGHGTIMGRYINNLDVNSVRVGTQFDLNTDYGGFETVISDIGTLTDSQSTKSRVFGGRVYFKPVSLWDPESFLNIFAIGATVVSDLNAPLTLPPANGQVQTSANGENVAVATTTSATVFGFDAEAQVMHNALLDLIPYTDMNFINKAGDGWHAGIQATAKMPIGFSLTIPVRLEYRRFASNYEPMYFSTFYEMERYNYPLNGAGTPKAFAVRTQPGPTINGIYADLALNFLGLVQVGAAYQAYDGGKAPFTEVYVSVPALETIQAKAYYAREGRISKWSDIFAQNASSMIVAEARYEMYSYIYLVARWSRMWTLNTNANTSSVQPYVSSDTWNFGFEASFNY